MGIEWRIESPQDLVLASGMVLIIPILTRFFATRRGLFIRAFVPNAKREHFERQLPQGESFTRSMKIMAAVQLALPLSMFVYAVVWWCRT